MRYRYYCPNGHRVLRHTLEWRWNVCGTCGDYCNPVEFTRVPVTRTCFPDYRLQVGTASEGVVYGPKSAMAVSQVLKLRETVSYVEWRRAGYRILRVAAEADTRAYSGTVDGGGSTSFRVYALPREAYRHYREVAV